MDIEESRRYIETRTGWKINEETFEVIEAETCAWVAEVATSHLKESVSFFLIAQGYDHFIIEKRWRHRLGAWFNRHL